MRCSIEDEGVVPEAADLVSCPWRQQNGLVRIMVRSE